MAASLKKHKHVVLREKLQANFAKLKSNSQIPSARELAATFNVSIMTVRQSLAALQVDGLIYTIPGSGTFVAGEKLSKKFVFVSFSEEIIEKGMKPSSQLLKAERVQVIDKKLAEHLQIESGEYAYRLKRVRLADGIPMSLEDSHIPCDNAPGLLDHNLKGSLYEIFKEIYERPVIKADSIISPILLNKEQAGFLKAPINTPSLMFTLTAYDRRGRTMEHCTSIKRGDKYDFRMSIEA